MEIVYGSTTTTETGWLEWNLEFLYQVDFVRKENLTETKIRIYVYKFFLTFFIVISLRILLLLYWMIEDPSIITTDNHSDSVSGEKKTILPPIVHIVHKL